MHLDNIKNHLSHFYAISLQLQSVFVVLNQKTMFSFAVPDRNEAKGVVVQVDADDDRCVKDITFCELGSSHVTVPQKF